MNGSQQVIEALRRSGIIKPDRHDVNSKFQGAFHLAKDMRGDIGVLAIYKDEAAGAFDGSKYGFGVRTARRHISRSDPAIDAPLLEGGNDCGGCRRILVSVADEDVLAHRSGFSALV
jgi:hypothetical protein